MWVQLKQVKIIDIMGVPTRKYPGDWVDVGKQTALSWIADGSAHTLEKDAMADIIDYTAGIVAIPKLDDNIKAALSEKIPHLGIKYSEVPEIAFSETLIYNNSLKPLRLELIHVGFKHLEQWQVLAPIWDYKELASDLGTKEDRELTKAVIRDLRVPVYDPKLIFVRRCDETKALIESWLDWQTKISDYRLAFQCALYQVKPLVYPLPTAWINKDMVKV